MMALSGNMHSVPMTPVNVRRGAVTSALSLVGWLAARSSSLARDRAV
jgi:hypothetical protein